MDLKVKARLLYIIFHWRLTWNKRDTNYLPPDLTNPKFVTARDAAKLIPDAAAVISSGMAANSRCSIFYWAIRERFEATGHPRDLTWIAVGAQGGRGRVPGTLEELAQPGLITRYLGGHLETVKGILRLGEDCQCELHSLPQGQMTFLLEAQARGESEVVSTTAVGTFLDPRVGPGSPVTADAKTNFISVRDDKLVFRLPLINVAIFIVPYADAEGNLYRDNAAMITESRESARAVRKNGGQVLAAVSEIIAKDDQKIFLPADLVDAIVVNPRNEQTGAVPQRRYWQMFTEGAQEDVEDSVARLKFINNVLKLTPVRAPTELAVARMAASLFTRAAQKGAFVNIGVGLPEEVCRLIYENGLHRDVTFATETGVHGGLPTPGIFFGAAINPTRIMSSAEIFHLFYEKLDVAILGLLQADSLGNVNVSKRGEGPLNYVGPGGFPDLVAAAKVIIFIGTWMAHAQMKIVNGRLKILKPGVPKFVAAVDQITFNGRQALARGAKVYYATNVGVFHLTERGMELIEVMPGVDIKRDILEGCPMKVVAPEGQVPVAPPMVVTGQGFRLQWQ